VTSLCVLLALALASPTPAAPQRRVVDRVAGTVNGEVITFRELEQRAGSAYVQAEAMGPGAERDKARGEVLRAAFDQIVSEKLFGSQIKTLGVEVSDAQIDQAIEQVRHDALEGIGPRGRGSEDPWPLVGAAVVPPTD